MATALLEFVQHTGALEVDAAKGIVRGVRILGLESANGRTYLREGVARALHLYEGRQVNIDHPERPGTATTINRRVGWLENVRQDADGGLRADLNLLLTDPQTPKILEAAQRRPQLMGLSHNASGKTRREGGREIVEAIEAVHSVDLVADPATVSGLNEGRNVKRTVKQLIEELKASRPGYARALKEYAEAGLMSPDQQMDDPGPKGDSEPADHEQALKQGFRAAILACLDDDGLDLKGKVKKIKEILTMEEKMLAKGDDGGSADDAPAPPTEEGKKRCGGNLSEARALRMVLESKVELTPILSKALEACKTEDEARKLIESVKSQPPPVQGVKPRSAAPIQEQKTVQTSAQTPADQDKARAERVASLRKTR